MCMRLVIEEGQLAGSRILKGVVHRATAFGAMNETLSD